MRDKSTHAITVSWLSPRSRKTNIQKKKIEKISCLDIL